MLLQNLKLFGINFILNLCKIFWDNNPFFLLIIKFATSFRTSFLFSPKKNAARKRTEEALSEKKGEEAKRSNRTLQPHPKPSS
jgi:hypothetical protein